MSADPSPAIDRARTWSAQDPDSHTQAELNALIERCTSGDGDAVGELEQLFSGRLAFGTAGIRGPLQPGPRGMNRVVVGQTTAGLAQHLLATISPAPGKRLRVVVGCDARTNSDVFAMDTAAIFAGHGMEAILLPVELPTPVLAFAVRALTADAGVMITASHNPPEDNGYKVYLGGADEGSQIIPPVDRAIEDRIVDVAATLDWHEILRDPSAVQEAPLSLVADYVEATTSSVSPVRPQRVALPIVYTAMHGVGAGTFRETLHHAGFGDIIPVAEQISPDAEFPTVEFPNPEEAGALDLAAATAREHQAVMILAHDPDADRLAVALPQGNGYVTLTGNQVGAILGWHCASRARASGRTGALANSLVSSPVLGKIAQHFGLDHHETLTGFKYVSRVPNLIFGFEEALGYLVSPDVVHDKDGISAGLMMLDVAHALAAEGTTLWGYLEDIEASVGGFASSQITIPLARAAKGDSIPTKLRINPPSTIGARTVSARDDFLDSVGEFPPENILRYYLDEGSRVIIRPSGTEPKLKIYLDTQGETNREAAASLRALEQDLGEMMATYCRV